MNNVRRIAKNTGVLLLADIINKIFGFFVIMYSARYLGTEGYGIMSFALALTGIFNVVIDLGLGQLTVREVAKDKALAHKYLGNIISIKIILALLTFGLIALVIHLMENIQQTIEVVYFVALYMIFNSFNQLFYSIYQAFEKMEYQSIGQILNSILLLCGILFAIMKGFNVIGFASIYFISGFIVLAYNFLICACKFVLPKIEADWNFWKSTMIEALPFGLSSIFVIIYFYIDTVMLSLMKGNEVVGWYSASYRLVYFLLFIPLAYFSSVYPIMSRFFKMSEDSLKFTYEKSFKYMIILAFPISIGITLLADNIILLIFGAEYVQSIVVLKILIWGVFFSYLAYTPLYTLNSINKQMIYTRITFLGMIFNFILNLILIPILSHIGASIATVATEFIVSGLLFYFVKIYFRNISYEFIPKLMISSMLFIGVSMYISNFINIWLSVLIGMLIYTISLFLFRIISQDDTLVIKKIIIKEQNQKHLLET